MFQDTGVIGSTAEQVLHPAFANQRLSPLILLAT